MGRSLRKRALLLGVSLFLAAASLLIMFQMEDGFAKDGPKCASELFFYVNGKKGMDETRILSRKMGRKRHGLFLPSNADLSSLEIFFACPEGRSVTYQGKKLNGSITVDLFQVGEFRKEQSAYEIKFGIEGTDGTQEACRLFVMASEHIPSIYLVSDDPDTRGRKWIESTPDHSNEASGFVYELDENGRLLCKQNIEKIRIRGNFTALADKKAYQFKLREKEDMLDIGEPRKSFALLANAYDTTLLHNTVTSYLGKELGLFDSPDCRPVDVYYDGVYRGNYLLIETPGLSSTSIAAEENGSCLMQLDLTHYMEKEHYLALSNGMHVTIDEPDDISDEQIARIGQIWEELLELVKRGGGYHPANGKTIEEYIDVDSYARYYLVQQFCKNPDGFASSTYCYIPSGEEKIYFGALWDLFAQHGRSLTGESPECA